MHNSLDYFSILNKTVSMQRYLTSFILSDLGKKIVVLTGPRQVGKTTLAKAIQQHYQRPPVFELGYIR